MAGCGGPVRRGASGVPVPHGTDPRPELLSRGFAGECGIGLAALVREGTSGTVISYGRPLPLCAQAADELAREHGCSFDVIDLRSIFPYDWDMISRSVLKTGRVVIVTKAPRTGGFHSELIALINDHALEYLEAPVARVTGFDVPMPYLLSEDLYLPDAGRVVEAMQSVKTY